MNSRIRLQSRNLFPLLILIVFFTSCKKDVVEVDPTISASPVIALPIGRTTLTLEHLIDPNDPDDTLLSANNENTYQVVLAQSDVVNTGFDNLVSIPSQSLINRTTKMGDVPVPNISVSQSVTLDDVANSAGGSFQSGMSVSLSDINVEQGITLKSITDSLGSGFQSNFGVNGVSGGKSVSLQDIVDNSSGITSFSISDISVTQDISLDDVANNAGGSLQSSLTVGAQGASESISLQDIANNASGLNSSLVVSDFSTTESISLDDISNSAGGSFQSSLSVGSQGGNQSISLEDISNNAAGLNSSLTVSNFSSTESISLDDISNSAGGALQSNLSVGSTTLNESISLESIANSTGGALQSSLSVSNVSTSQSISLEDISNDAGGSLQSSLTISSVNKNQNISLGQMANDIGGSFQQGINSANGSNSIFPPFSESNIGTYGGGSLGNFTSATLSNGTLTLKLTNEWPVPMSMDIDLVNKVDSSVILSYSFTNIPSGGNSSQTKSLAGKSLPSTLGFKIVSVSSPGSGFNQVPVDTSDAVNLDVTTANMVASSYNAPFPSINETNLGSYSGGAFGSFTSATFSSGSMDLELVNNWPVPLSMNIDLIDTVTNGIIASFSFLNVSSNGGSSTSTASLIGKTMPNTTALKVASVQSPGSTGSVNIVLSDDIDLNLSTSNLEVSTIVTDFPSVNESDVATYGGSLGSFTSATFSSGSLDLSITNNWPVPLSIEIDLIDTVTNNSIVSYSFNNVSGGGSSSSQSASLAGKTLPNSTGFKIKSVQSPGSTGPVTISMQDAIDLVMSTSNLNVSSLVAAFPAVNETNLGTYSGGSLGSFTSATFDGGTMSIGLTNNWPASLSMDIDLVDTLTNSTITSFSLSNVGPNGGSKTDTKSLTGLTLPSTMGIRIASVSSPGTTTPTTIDLTDALDITLSTNNLSVSSVVAPFPSVNETNVGSFSGGSMVGFTSATFSGGTMDLTMTNNWPVPLSMAIDLIDTTNNSTLLSFNFSNVSGNGGSSTESASLSGKTITNTLGIRIASVSSPGSTSDVVINMTDEVSLGLATSNVSVSSLVAAFPAVNETNLGTYSGGSLGSFTSATFDGGTMSLSLTNNWPAPLSMGINLVDTITNQVITSFTLNNAAANGGSASDTKSLNGITIPSSMGIQIASVSSPGSSSSTTIDLSDELNLNLSTNNLSVASVVAPFPAVNETNVGTFGAGGLGGISSVTFDGGSMDLSMTNNWPVPLSMVVDLIDTSNNNTIVSYNFTNVLGNGGSATETGSIAGKTITDALAIRIASVSSPGSTGDVTINMTDDLSMSIGTTGLSISNFVGPFPSFNESNVGTFSQGPISGFTSASFSGGSLSVGITNNWPIPLSMSLDLVNTVNDSTIFSYNFNNVAGNGGTSVQSQSMQGITLPNTLGFKVVSVSSPGSNNAPISVNMNDTLGLAITGTNLTAASFVANFPAINQTNVGTYSAGTLSSFTSASFSQGDLSLTLENGWPVPLSMGIDVVDMSNSNTLLSYNFSNVAAGGGVNTQTASLAGVTLPNSIGLKINSVTSPGSNNTPITINLTDSITFTVGSSNLSVYNAVVQLDTTVLAAQDEMVDLGIAGVELEEISFNTCELNYEFESTLQADVEVKLTMLSTDKNGSPIDTTILIAADQTTTGTISLANTIIDLTTDTIQPHSRLPIALSTTVLGTTSQITVDSSQYISAVFDMDNISFEYIEGYFGDTSLALPSSTIDLNLDMLNQLNGEITFEDPAISIGVTNSVGLPIELDLDFISYRDGIGYNLNATPQIFPFPTTVGDSATGIIIYDNTNSSITDVFTFPADSLSYSGTVSINPDTVTYGKYNFITSESRISGDLLLDLPFEFSTSNLSMGQTIDSNLNLSSYLESDFYDLGYAKLNIHAISTLPLNVNVELKFYDASGMLVLVKPLPILESGIPNADGVVVTPKTTITQITLSSADFDALVNATEVYAEASMSTFNNGGVPVKLRTDAYISLDLGVEAKIDFEL